MKVIKSLKNTEISLKGTTRKISTQKGGLLNILASLARAGLVLMKSVLTPLAKSVLISLGLTAEWSATKVYFRKKIDGSGTTTLITSN